MLFVLQAMRSQADFFSKPHGRGVHLGTTQSSLVPNFLAVGGGQCRGRMKENSVSSISAMQWGSSHQTIAHPCRGRGTRTPLHSKALHLVLLHYFPKFAPHIQWFPYQTLFGFKNNTSKIIIVKLSDARSLYHYKIILKIQRYLTLILAVIWSHC